MFKRSAPFLLGALLVALSGTNALADRPIKEAVDPLYLSGDPIEPDKANAVLVSADPSDVGGSAVEAMVVAQSGPVERGPSWMFKLLCARVLAFWSSSWPMR